MDSRRLKTFSSIQELESATGSRFEMYAQYVLTLIHPNYIGTRLHQDDGVDGLIISRKSKREISAIFYAIHGPERYTGWSNKFSKLKKDVRSIESFASSNFESFTVKFVLNYQLSASEAVALHEWMDAKGLAYETLTPQRLFSKLTGGVGQLQNAVAFIDSIEQEDRPLTDWNNHIFAGKVLENLSTIDAKSDITDTMNGILQMRAYLLSFVGIEDIRISSGFSYKDGSNNTPLMGVPKMPVLKKNTQVNSGCRTVYLIDRETPKVRKLSDNEYENMFLRNLDEEDPVFVHDFRTVAVKVEDLSSIFQILNHTYANFEQHGKSSLYLVAKKIALWHKGVRRMQEGRQSKVENA